MSVTTFKVVAVDVNAADVPLPPRGLDTADRPVDQQAIKSDLVREGYEYCGASGKICTTSITNIL